MDMPATTDQQLDSGFERPVTPIEAARLSHIALAIAVVASVLFGFVPTATAQNTEAVGFAATNFEPSPSQHTGVLNLDRPDVLGHLTPSAGLFFHFADDPVQIVSEDGEEVRDRIVDDQYMLEAGLALGLFDYFELGVSIPYVVGQTGGNLENLGGAGSAAGSSFADIRTSLEIAILKPQWAGGFGISASGTLYAPSGSRSNFTSDGAVRGLSKLSVGWESEQGYEIIGNVGMELGPTIAIRNYAKGSFVRWGLGGVAPTPVDRLDVMATVYGGSTMVQPDPARANAGNNKSDSLEAVGGFRIDLPADVRAQFGGGAGMLDGVGTPDFRLFTSLHWAGLRRDSDGDGLLDRNDACPREPEDFDEFEDADGCPDPDNDGDGILDEPDECPETKGPEDNDGCPVEDSDGDGILDDEDECPDDPEDVDGFEDEDGCPDPDNDEDGVLDEEDECPDTPGVEDNDGCPDDDRDGDGIVNDEDQCPGDPEDKDGYKDEDGCPDKDNDGDGILDEEDECPNKPETVNGYEDEDGCPDEAKAEVVEQKIEISEKVHFEYDSATIKSQSYELLRDVARILRKYDQITGIQIEGHTDSRGPADYNRKLSQERAEAVQSFLVDEGIEEGRISTVGRGESSPVASNDTEEGRAENRRVEFVITEVDGEPAEEGGAILEKEREDDSK